MKIENKMTAVDWLVEQMINRNFFARDTELSYTTLDHLQYEAKEMEKQQLNDAYNADRPNLTCYEENTAFKEYYNETFNNED